MALRLHVFSHETCNVSLKLDGGSVMTKRVLTSTIPHPSDAGGGGSHSEIGFGNLARRFEGGAFEGVVTTKLSGTRRCRNRMGSDL